MAEVFRTDQVGSLIRPESLLTARDEWLAGRMSRDGLRPFEDAAVLQALELQREVGIDVFTDGEMRRDAWMTSVSQAVDGFADTYPKAEQTRPDGIKVMVQTHSKHVTGRLHQRERLSAHEAAFLREHAPGPFKITIPSPVMISRSSFRPGVTDAVYQDRKALLADCLPIIHNEVHALVNEGAAYIQLDFGFAAYVNDAMLAAMKQQGLDPEQELTGDIAAENSIYDTLPRDRVTLGIHICRGNRTAWGGGVGSYDWLSEHLFRDLHVDRFVLEYDSDRAGGFEPLRHVPEGKVVALGLVTTKSPQLESQETLLRRIEEATRYCPIDRLALSPQCGFQSSALRDGAFMTMDDEKRKLELIVDTARQVWGDQSQANGIQTSPAN